MRVERLFAALLLATCCCASAEALPPGCLPGSGPAPSTGPMPGFVGLPPDGPTPAYTLPFPVYDGYAIPAPARSYAYGWFGVPRRCSHQKTIHYGYYQNYTQWSYR